MYKLDVIRDSENVTITEEKGPNGTTVLWKTLVTKFEPDLVVTKTTGPIGVIKTTFKSISQNELEIIFKLNDVCCTRSFVRSG